MKQAHAYTLYRPKWYRKRVSTWWWAQQWRSFKFILRELSSIAVGYVGAMLLWMIWSLIQGPESYANFLAWLKSPLIIVMSLIAFGFVLYHSITWFNLAPKAMPVRVGGKRLPEWMVAAPNYVAWIVVSAVVIWFVIGGK
ncbi:MAG: fumarate reductase subunit C [Acidobacteria bacterium]|nr:fumarate reductase subunit C [Acidobacteriota bacterium]